MVTDIKLVPWTTKSHPQLAPHGGPEHRVDVNTRADDYTYATLGFEVDEDQSLTVTLPHDQEDVHYVGWNGEALEVREQPKGLEISTRRVVHHRESADLVFGTGALMHPWWVAATLDEPGADGEWESVDLERQIDGDFSSDATILVTHWDGESEGGAVRTRLTLGQIAQAAARTLPNEILVDDIGLADALEADAVLQTAVFGKVVYG